MADAIAARILAVTRTELARALAELCQAVGAAESSILLPKGEDALIFFASSNAALMGPGAPVVPVSASFTGLAYRTGQTIAFADAASQQAHNKAVDQHVGLQTHEFAAIPIHGQSVVGVVTLVNRPTGTAPRPFDMAELRQAADTAQGMAQSITLLARLGDDGPEDGADALDPDLLTDLAALTGPERQMVHNLASSLLQNRAA